MAGKITATTFQCNDSSTATNNFVLKTDNAGGIKLSRGNDGATSADIISVDSSGNVSATTSFQTAGIAMPRMVQVAAVATTSGTTADFTSIPSWVKRITIALNVVSTNGTSNYLVRIGDSGGVSATGYTSRATNNAGVTSSTTGFILTQAMAVAADTVSGVVTLVNVSGNIWSAFGIVDETSRATSSAGNKTLTGTLDRVRLTTVTPDTFDAGSVSIIYEG